MTKDFITNRSLISDTMNEEWRAIRNITYTVTFEAKVNAVGYLFKICGFVIRRAFDITMMARNNREASWWLVCPLQSPGYLLFVASRRCQTRAWFIAVQVLLLLALQSLENLSLLQNCPPLYSVLLLTSPCPHVHVLEILPVVRQSFKWPHYVCSVGSTDNIVVFTSKNDDTFLGMGFMLSQSMGHKNEDAGLLGCYVVLNGKQLHRSFLDRCNVDRTQTKTPI